MENFPKFPQSHPTFESGGKIRYYCSKCENEVFHDIEEVKKHLYRYGFVFNYHHWTSHGKAFVDNVSPSNCYNNFDIEEIEPYNTY